MTIVEKNRYLFAPPFCKTVETFILPIPKSKFEAPNGLSIGGGWRYFDQTRVIQKKNDSYVEVIMTPSKLLSYSKIHSKSSLKKAEMHFENIVRKRLAYSKCDMSQPHLMGVINLTPDSFYNKSKKQDYSSVKKTLKKMENYGASIIDIGGESTRPSSKIISTSEEQRRVMQIIKS